MLAGGSGITPMFQVSRAMLENPNDRTNVYVIYANITYEDILLKSSLPVEEITNALAKMGYEVMASNVVGCIVPLFFIIDEETHAICCFHTGGETAVVGTSDGEDQELEVLKEHSGGFGVASGIGGRGFSDDVINGRERVGALEVVQVMEVKFRHSRGVDGGVLVVEKALAVELVIIEN
ncbi:hypothetical protein ACH5RR_000010 [Cinchona calisaya]|uniref:Oxidoreductase FAD/NAD(P)-binding domain-containing protein n=1 Tax=Cinchona calisaya TaxID=153742 RepID=A0ABD3B0B0_9GENT